MLKFFVQDMLDFQIIRAEKLMKDISIFKLKDAIEEVKMMLEYTSINNGVAVKVEYRNEEVASNPDYKIKTDCQRL